MNERTILTIAYMFAAVLVLLQSTKPVSMNPTYVSHPQIPPAHAQLIDERRGDLVKIANLYNYDYERGFWDFEELQTPLLTKEVIFRFKRIESEGRSAFVVIIPVANKELAVIPLSYYGFGPAVDLKRDPHNFAIFNSIVASEQPVLATDSERLSFALLYMCLVEEVPKILELNNPTSVSPQRPTVQTDPDGEFEVSLSEKTPSKVQKISLSFDAKGFLRSVEYPVD